MTAATRPVRRVPMPRIWPVRASDLTAIAVGNGLLIVGMWVRLGDLTELDSLGGEHILVPAAHRPPAGLVSLAVVGPSLTYADAFATAAYAMGRDGVAWLAERVGYEALAITDDDRLVWTPGMDALLA